MPTYEYECAECGYRFEVFQNMSDAPLKECEKCEGGLKRLIFGGTGVIFKGSGFYVTDNKGKAKPAASEKTKEGDKKDAPAAAEKTSADAGLAEKKPEKKEAVPAE